MTWTSLLELLVVLKLCVIVGTSVKDTLHKALELYKTKHPWNARVTFIHCWLVLKYVPRFGDVHVKLWKPITPSMKHNNTFALNATIKLDESEVQFENVELSTIRWP